MWRAVPNPLGMQSVFVMALVFALMRQAVQAADSGSGGGIFDTIPRCIMAKPHPYCTIIGSTADHFVINHHEIEDIFTTLREGAANSSYICGQFFVFSACFYSYRDCDNRGNQKLICGEVCPLISTLYDECVSSSVVAGLIHGTSNEGVRDFLNFALSFNCFSTQTYKIDGVGVSESCQDLSFIYTLFPEIAEVENTTESTQETSSPLKLSLGLGVPLLIIVLIGLVVFLVVVVVRLYKSKRNLEKRIQKVPFRNDYNGELPVITEGFKGIQLSAEEQCFYQERFDKAVISPEQLEMGETIGEGTFGVVCKAVLLTHTFSQAVAVKKARNLTSKEQLRSLLNESLLMKRFDHPNVVGLLGVCFDTPEGYPYLVLPFMAKGNIRDYLKDRRVHTSDTASLPHGITVTTLTVMCLDVARGMEYLSGHKFVHRDLAARNCMLDEEGVVKVGDFGMARDVYSHLYYRGDKHSEIPVKWSAPETLTDGLSTVMSDVWSYGIVCWEVFSLGATPYPGVSNYDIPHYITSGKRLAKPPLCPQDVYALMEKCWKIKPEDRPAFSELVAALS